MTARPLSVSIIAWFLIVSCIAGLLTLFVVLSEPSATDALMHNPLRLTEYGFLSLLILGIFGSAIEIFKGRRRGIIVYLCCGFLGIVFSVPLPIHVMILPLAIYAASLYFLGRPEASEFFKSHAPATLVKPEAKEPRTASQIKYPGIKRCIDWAAATAIVYPGFAMLWSQYENAPSPFDTQGNIIDVIGFLEMAAVLLGIPGVVWLWWRVTYDPPGPHPILAKFVTDQRFAVSCIAAYVPLFAVLHNVLTLIRR
jgi:hypothetical protein